MNHAENRAIVVEAWPLVFDRKPTLFEARTVHATAQLETGFGEGWRGAGAGSNNLGADQAPGCPEDSFAYVDTHPNPDGTSTEYKVCFRKYRSKLLGAVGLIQLIQNRPEVVRALAKGSELAYSAAMWTSVYYEGFGADEDDRIVNHYLAIVRHAQTISRALGEPMPVGARLLMPPDPGKATLRFGSTGALVAEWQRIIGAVADGIFGRYTETATRRWQTAHGLTADGVVGPITWAASSE